MTVLEIALPYPPSINHYWRHVARKINGRTIVVVHISAEGVAFRKSVKAMMKNRTPLCGEELFAEVFLFPPDKRKRDIDNPIKSLLDALQHAKVYADDCQVSRLYIERREQIKGGEVLVRLHSLK